MNYIDQDGNLLDMNVVRQSRHNEMQAHYHKLLPNFMPALKLRCQNEGIPFGVQEHHHFGRVYILGTNAFIIRVNSDNIEWSRIQ